MFTLYDYAAIAVALAGCLLGTRCDLSTGKIPNKLTGAMLAASALISFLRVYDGDASFPSLYLMNFFLGFIIGFGFWLIRAWSGGDAKIFWAICSLLPGYSGVLRQYAFLPLPGYSEHFLGISLLFNLLILLIVRFFLSAVYLYIGKGRIKDLARTISSPIMYILASMLLGIGIARASGIESASYLSIVFVLLLGLAERYSYVLFVSLWAALSLAGLVLSNASGVSALLLLLYGKRQIFLFTFLLSAYTVGSRIPQTRRVALKDLRPGMSISEEIYLEGGVLKREEVSPSIWNAFVSWILKKEKRVYLVRPGPAGLSGKDLARLRLNSDALGGSVQVNRSFILMPFLTGALIISFFGDFLWIMLA